MKPIITVILLLTTAVILFLTYQMLHSSFTPPSTILCRHGKDEPESSNGTRYFNQTSTFRLNYERRKNCNVHQREQCQTTNKSIVLTFWGEKSKDKWIPQHLLSVFPTHSFDHLIFVYDNSTWLSHPAYQQVIVIHVQDQTRFWYVKRFLQPSMIKSYRFIWCVDDDVQLEFDPLQYECLADRLNVPLSSPARLSGAWSHKITLRQDNYMSRIGRWTDLIETGPLFVASSSAWLCIYEYLDASTGSGWGLDLIWCRMLAEKCFPSGDATNVCGIFDVFGLHHQSKKVNSGSYGSPEVPLYKELYSSWFAKSRVYGPLAQNQSALQSCSS